MWIGYVILKCSEALLIEAEHILHGATFEPFSVEKRREGVLKIVDSKRGSSSWILRKTSKGIEVVKSTDAKEYADVMVLFESGFIDSVEKIKLVLDKLVKEEMR